MTAARASRRRRWTRRTGGTARNRRGDRCGIARRQRRRRAFDVRDTPALHDHLADTASTTDRTRGSTVASSCGEVSTHRVADDVGRLDPEVIEQRLRVAHHRPVLVRRRIMGLARPAVAPCIPGDHPASRSNESLGHLRLVPVACVFAANPWSNRTRGPLPSSSNVISVSSNDAKELMPSTLPYAPGSGQRDRSGVLATEGHSRGFVVANSPHRFPHVGTTHTCSIHRSRPPK